MKRRTSYDFVAITDHSEYYDVLKDQVGLCQATFPDAHESRGTNVPIGVNGDLQHIAWDTVIMHVTHYTANDNKRMNVDI
jgi:hypothetical protein